MLRAVSWLGTTIAGLTQTRHFDSVQPTSRATAREPAPNAASSTMRARLRIRASLLREPASASSALRSSMVKAITVAYGIGFISMTNYDSRFSDSGYLADLRPLHGLASRPASPDLSKRDDQTETVRGEVFSRAATSLIPMPSRRDKMIPARKRSRCAVARPFALRLSSAFTSSEVESTLIGRAIIRFPRVVAREL